jgi:hypothetical protein
MQFLFEYLALQKGMKIYNTDTPVGYVDCNIHIPEGFEALQLRRRPRKKVFWRKENGKIIPYFKKGDQLVKALILHFQGPGKRVFFRFNGGRFFATKTGLRLLNLVFQKKNIADWL